MFVPFGETFMSIPDTSKLISEIVRGNSKESGASISKFFLNNSLLLMT